MSAAPSPILEGLVGSHAYGLATEASDRDWKGVFVASRRKKLGVSGYGRTYDSKSPAEDRVLWELGHFAGLAAQANPTVLEVLWLDEYRTLSEAGRLLVEGRDFFLSKRARKSYGGYAEQQVRKLLARGDFGADLRNRTEKHGRHVWRLIFQGLHLAEHGEVLVRLYPAQVRICRRAGEWAADDPGGFAEGARECIAGHDAAFDRSDLPDAPDVEALDGLVGRAYEAAWLDAQPF